MLVNDTRLKLKEALLWALGEKKLRGGIALFSGEEQNQTGWLKDIGMHS
jgi:hypothetical protein